MFSWEIPAGSTDGEDFLKAAQRELKEETGFIARRWLEIGTFQELNGYCSGIGHVFLAGDLEQTSQNEQEEEGITSVKKFSLTEVSEMIKKGEITDAPTIVAITQASFYLDGFLKP